MAAAVTVWRPRLSPAVAQPLPRRPAGGPLVAGRRWRGAGAVVPAGGRAGAVGREGAVAGAARAAGARVRSAAWRCTHTCTHAPPPRLRFGNFGSSLQPRELLRRFRPCRPAGVACPRQTETWGERVRRFWRLLLNAEGCPVVLQNNSFSCLVCQYKATAAEVEHSDSHSTGDTRQQRKDKK